MLEVACNPGIPGFALTERNPPDLWRWAIIGAKGSVVFEGCEDTEMKAKRIAVDMMRHVMVRFRNGES
jgi:hypothetical protein